MSPFCAISARCLPFCAISALRRHLAPGDIERPGDIEIPEDIEAAANFVADIFADNIFGFPSSVQVHDGADRHPGLG